MVSTNFVLHYTGNRIYVVKAQNSSEISLKLTEVLSQSIQTHLVINRNVISPFQIVSNVGVTL